MFSELHLEEDGKCKYFMVGWHFRYGQYSHSVGSLTEYQGHQIVIDCLLKDAPDNRPDSWADAIKLFPLHELFGLNSWDLRINNLECSFAFY